MLYYFLKQDSFEERNCLQAEQYDSPAGEYNFILQIAKEEEAA